MFKKILTTFFVIFTFVEAQNVQLPSSFQICQRTSSNLASCVKNSIEFLRPYLMSGDLGGGIVVPAIEPLKIDNIQLNRGQGFFFHMNNIKAYKISNFQIDKIKIKPENFHVDLIMKIPNVQSTADYKINLMLGIVKIQGQGKLTGAIDEIKVRLTIDTESFMKNGVEYRKVSKLKVLVKLKNLVLQIKDLFKDPTLNQVGEQLVNQNLPMFLPEIEKSIQTSIERIAMQTANRIVENIPFRQLLP